ncbi:hypothetical protein GQR58_029728 [Nymphon striatum]|nr:hypothetical protein GQR58_029728 [Nymphon striatum]
MGLNSAFKLIGDLPRKLPRYEVSTRLPAFAIGHDHDHCVAAQAVLRRLLRVQTRCGPWVDSAEPTGPMANLWRGHALAPAHDRTVTRVPGWSGKSGPDQQRNSDCCWTEASTKRQSQREDADLEKSEQRFGRVDVKPETASMAHTVREHVRDAPAARALTKKRAMPATLRRRAQEAIPVRACHGDQGLTSSGSSWSSASLNGAVITVESVADLVFGIVELAEFWEASFAHAAGPVADSHDHLVAVYSPLRLPRSLAEGPSPPGHRLIRSQARAGSEPDFAFVWAQREEDRAVRIAGLLLGDRVERRPRWP